MILCKRQFVFHKPPKIDIIIFDSPHSKYITDFIIDGFSYFKYEESIAVSFKVLYLSYCQNEKPFSSQS